MVIDGIEGDEEEGDEEEEEVPRVRDEDDIFVENDGVVRIVHDDERGLADSYGDDYDEDDLLETTSPTDSVRNRRHPFRRNNQ